MSTGPATRSPLVKLALPFLWLLVACSPASALTFDVDRTDDDATQTACTDAPNDCTLRGAIIAANNTSGADTINLPAGTYTLTIPGAGEDFAATGDLDIRDSLIIHGAGADTTIVDGGGLDRVFQTDPAGNGSIAVTLFDLTIQNGSAPQMADVNDEGGGIRNGATVPTGVAAGTLHLNDVTVDHNTSAGYGGGISNDGTLTMVNCLVSNNVSGALAGGGGIVQDDEGSASMNGTTISDNDADEGGTAAGAGGGISIGFSGTGAGPTVNFEACTLSGNMARTGGGLLRIRGTLTLRNCTISGNTATQASGDGGGGIGDSGGQPTTLVNSTTIFNNGAAATDGGGGIVAGGAGIRLTNTIIAGNTGGGTPSDIVGTLISESHNLIGKATGFTLDPSSDTTGDINGVATSKLHLGPLVHDSGPPTATHALLFGSPAIDRGTTAPPQGEFGCPNTDQRGQTRPADGNGDHIAICDIGAYEAQGVPPKPTHTATPKGPVTTATPTGPVLTPTPTVTVTPNPGAEICDNCVDDDGDGLVDRDDPGCDQPYDGGGDGIGDPARAKRLVKCAAAIEKSGAKVASARFAQLHKCVDAVFACKQLKPGDAACLAKAQASCDKAITALAGNDAHLEATIEKACGPPVEPQDLVDAQGLGYGGHAYRCGLVGAAPPVDAASVAACVAREHACRVDAALAVQEPRVGEMLALVGHDVSELPCLPAATSPASGLGNAATAKLAVKCEQTISKAETKLLSSEVKLVPQCANAVLACVQLQTPKCADKSRAVCAKTSGKVNALTAKLAPTIAKACEPSGLTLGDVLATDGVDFGSLASACAAAHVSSLASVDDLTTCLTYYQHCRAHQLLENELPRLRELLGTGQVLLP